MKPEAVDLLIEQKPKLKRVREKLEAMQSGAYCMHRAWGFGKIQDYDEAENKLIIDFEDDKPGHKMDPVFCVDKLEILSETNVLVRQRTHPEEVQEMIKKRQGDLVVEVLAAMKEQMASPTELENILSRLVGATKFKKWWTGTKKILVKDPRIATPSKKTDPYVLREEPLKPEQEILEDFYVLKQPKKKILLAEKLYQISDNVKEIEEDLPNIFDHLTTAIKDARGLNQAERLHAVWVRNDLARHLSEDPETIEPTSKSLILESEDISDLAIHIPSAYQKRFLDLLTRVYPEGWKEVLLEILKNSSGKLTNEIINFLNQRECEPMVAESFEKWLAEQSMKGPIIHWVIKNRHSRKYANLVQALVTPKMLTAMFYAIDYEALQNTTVRRIQLADVLLDDKSLIQDFLQTATEEEAQDLAQSLLLNQGFEDLAKKSLMARFIKLFPPIQSLLSGDEEEKTDELIVSRESLGQRKKEYEDLLNRKIPENKEAIQIAREHGDLKENAEYKMARQDQDTLLARKAQLEVDFRRARVSDFSEVAEDRIGVGSVVELAQPGEASQTFSILGAWDSAPERNILSYQTPLAQSLLGHGVGEIAQTEIDGNQENWEIKRINRWVDLGQSL